MRRHHIVAVRRRQMRRQLTYDNLGLTQREADTLARQRIDVAARVADAHQAITGLARRPLEERSCGESRADRASSGQPGRESRQARRQRRNEIGARAHGRAIARLRECRSRGLISDTEHTRIQAALVARLTPT